jgi:hypothetical protein
MMPMTTSSSGSVKPAVWVRERVRERRCCGVDGRIRCLSVEAVSSEAEVKMAEVSAVCVGRQLARRPIKGRSSQSNRLGERVRGFSYPAEEVQPKERRR